MTNTKRAFAYLLTFLMLASVLPTAVQTNISLTIVQSDPVSIISDTDFEITIEVFDHDEEFNDDEWDPW